MATVKRILVLGAAGRDFHDFNVCWRGRSDVRVVAFTATQIPGIDGRRYPASLAGPGYPEGIPIRPEADLERIVRDEKVDEVVLAYSDLNHTTVMHLASRTLAAGADFKLLGLNRTMLTSKKPVVAVCAVRTGCGKSPASRYVVRELKALGLRPSVVRHPMPYGDLEKQRVQRFASLADLAAAKATTEEYEDYEPHVAAGTTVFAGVDYEQILRAAEAEGDVVLWDGGNNDMPFYRPDLYITIADPHRPGHELGYHPGEANFRAADVIIVAKADSADPENVATVRRHATEANPRAKLLNAGLEVTVDNPEVIRGKKVLVIEDGPTLTHGEMAYGAGIIAAKRYGAIPVDPRAYAVGPIREMFEKYGHLGPVLPAVGYYPEQLAALAETVRRTPCEAVLVATPTDLRRHLDFGHPSTQVRYELQDLGEPTLRSILADAVRRWKS